MAPLAQAVVRFGHGQRGQAQFGQFAIGGAVKAPAATMLRRRSKE